MRSGHALILLVVALFSIGVVMVTSASVRMPANPSEIVSISADGTVSGSTDTVREILFGKYLRLAVISMLVLLIASLCPVERLLEGKGVASPMIWVGAFLMLAVCLPYVPGVGVTRNGATRWIELGPIGFQPSEFVKWGLPLFIAFYAVRNSHRLSKFFTGFLPPLLIASLVCGLIAMEDLGTAVLIMVVVVAVLMAAGVRVWHVMTMIPLGLGAFTLLVLAEPYRMKRIVAFLAPYDDPGGIGYHLVQSLSAITSGGLTGRGLGHSIQKFGYLPEINSDFIFAMVCEELGIFGAGLLLMVFCGILVIGLSIITGKSIPRSYLASNPADYVPKFSQLLGLGILLTFGLQAVINIAVVTGMAPTKGIALPLVSHGGTGWILTAASLGVLVSIDRVACGRARSERQDQSFSHIVAT